MAAVIDDVLCPLLLLGPLPVLHVEHFEVADRLVEVEVIRTVGIQETTDRPGPSKEGSIRISLSDEQRVQSDEYARNGVKLCPELFERRVRVGVLDAAIPVGCAMGMLFSGS